MFLLEAITIQQSSTLLTREDQIANEAVCNKGVKNDGSRLCVVGFDMPRVPDALCINHASCQAGIPRSRAPLLGASAARNALYVPGPEMHVNEENSVEDERQFSMKIVLFSNLKNKTMFHT